MLQLNFRLHKLLYVIIIGALAFSACAPAPTVAPVQEPAKTAEAVATQPAAVEPIKAPEVEVTVPQPIETTASVETRSELTPDRLVPEITIIYSTADVDPVRNEIGIMLTNEWEKLGLRVNPQPMDYDREVTILQTGEGYHAFTLGFDGRPERLDPDVLLRRVFYTGLNYMGYSNPEYDAVVDAQRAEMNINTRRDLVFKAQEILANDVPAITLYHDSVIGAYNSELWENVLVQPGRGVYNYWTLLEATPKTDQKVFKISHNELALNLNPFYVESTSRLMAELYDTLARVGMDGLPKPCAAESWEAIDPKTIAVTIRQGMKFNDGVPVTAKDVKYSYDVQKEKGAPVFKPFLANIETIDLVDDYHLTIHLLEPDASIYMATFTQIYIIPEHIWSNIPDPKEDYDNNIKPVGSGPYNFVYYHMNEEYYSEANKDYQFPVKPDGYTVVLYSNMDATFQAMVNREVDTQVESVSTIQAEAAKALPYLTVVEQKSHQVRLIGFNVRVAPFDDLKFRDAIGYTIDYDTIVNVILKGAGLAGAGIIAPSNEFWHNPNQLIRQYDIAKARELLAAAGYEWDSKGLLYMPVQ